MRQLVTIIPPASAESGHTLVQGTKVLLPTGEAVPGITKVVLVAEAGGIWSAEIHCHARMSEINGVVAHFHRGHFAWWRRLLCRMAGVDIDVTTFDSTSREHGLP